MRYTALLLVSLSLLASAGAAAAAETYTVHLGPTPLNDATKAKIRGRATATATLTGSQLSVAGAFSGLASPATTAEIRSGGGVGVPGPAIGALTVSPAAQGDLSGQVKLTAAQVKALRQGRLYVQINSQSAPPPAGNLWGWVLSPTLVLPGTPPTPTR
jgi:hypothetical protein